MKIIVTAGGTSEYIDTVRKITNTSSGRLGALITKELLHAGHEVWHIHTPDAEPVPERELHEGMLHEITIVTTKNLEHEVTKLLSCVNISWFIHAMAVSDYIVQNVTTAEKMVHSLKLHGLTKENLMYNTNNLNRLDKISSDEESLVITLKKAPKIISLVKKISPGTNLVGFKLLAHSTPEQLKKAATEIAVKNECSFVVANDIDHIENEQHTAFFFNKEKCFAKAETKTAIAEKIKETINGTLH